MMDKQSSIGRIASRPRWRASPRATACLGLTALIACAGCDPGPNANRMRSPVVNEATNEAVAVVAVENQAEINAAIERERQIASVRQNDRSLNWVNIGISTGKFSESLHSSVHRTYEECVASSFMEDNECFPIPALPDSYWNASGTETRQGEDRNGLRAQHDGPAPKGDAR